MRSTVFAFLLLSARGGAAALAAWAVCKLLRPARRTPSWPQLLTPCRS